MTKFTYATTMGPGYFMDSTKVLSRHRSAKAALKKAREYGYWDIATQRTRRPVAAVYDPDGFDRDEKIWADKYPQIVKEN